MPLKRPNNDGSVYQRKDGKWVAQVTLGSRRVYRYTKTKAEAQRKLNDLRLQRHQGKLTAPTAITLSAWLDTWLDMLSADLRPSTILTYRTATAHIAQVLGDTLLHRLNPLLLTQAFSELQRNGTGQRRLQLAHGYLRACLARAVDLELLASNPMDRVPRPRWTATKRRYWTVDEVRRFILTGLSEPGWYHPLFVFLVSTGLRISEAIALTWADVDWKQQTVQVDKSLVWSGATCNSVPPKTKAGNRLVALPASAVDALRLVSREHEPEARIFQTTVGGPPHPTRLRKYLRTLCDKAEVPYVNVHGLRHVAAMLALEATGDPYAVQRRLGHSNVNVTIGIYGYSARDDSQVASALDRLLDVAD